MKVGFTRSELSKATLSLIEEFVLDESRTIERVYLIDDLSNLDHNKRSCRVEEFMYTT